jgi:hypothetical protein
MFQARRSRDVKKGSVIFFRVLGGIPTPPSQKGYVRPKKEISQKTFELFSQKG